MSFFQKVSPRDSFEYWIPEKTIKDTEKILSQYAALRPSNEGLVYWGGTREQNKVIVRLVVAPETTSHFGGVFTSTQANFHFVKALSARNLIQIAQVHTHPGKWVDHSEGDNRDAAFKVNGLVSIVVPLYCEKGMMPLGKCGVHRYEASEFVRLSNMYVKERFKISSDLKSDLEDLRKWPSR